MTTSLSSCVFAAVASGCLALHVSSVQAHESQATIITTSYHSEAVIDAPLRRVWPCALDVKKWMNEHDLVHVSGTPNSEGEVVKVIPKGVPPSVPKEHYGFYAITKVRPLKQLVLKVYSAKGGSFGKRIIGFDNVTLYEEGSKTRVAFDMNEEATGPHLSVEEAAKQQQEEEAQVAQLLDIYWVKLRQLVEEGAKSP